MKLPDYTATDSIATGSTGPQASASELNPFNEESASKVAGGLQGVQKVAEDYDTKLDNMWAWQQSNALQGQWRENVNQYTDPDQFQKDFADSQKSTMDSAPSGRASDAFVREMGGFGNRMIGKVVYQKVAAERAQAAQELKDSNLRLEVEAREAGMDVAAQRQKAKEIAKLAKQIVPQDVIDQIHQDTNVALDKQEISNVANIAGSATAADKIADGTLGKNLQPAEAQALQHSYDLQGTMDLQTTKVKGQEFFNTQIKQISSGQLLGTTDEQDQALARVMASSTMDAHGSNYMAHFAKAEQVIKNAKYEGVMRTKLLGMSATEADDFVQNIETTSGAGSHEYITAKKIQGQFDAQKQKDPLQFTFNSPVFAQKYTNAVNMMDQAIESKDPQMIATAKSNFKDTLTTGLQIQSHAGIPENLQTVMTKPEAVQYSARLMKGGMKDADKAFDEMQQRYGDYMPQALQQLQSKSVPDGQRLPPHYAVVFETRDNPVVHETLMEAVKAENPGEGKGSSLNAQLKAQSKKVADFDRATTASMAKYSDALGVSTSGQQYASEMTHAVTSYAKQVALANPSLTPTQAADKAAQAVIYSQYDTHAVNGRALLVPRKDADGNPYAQSEVDQIKTNIDMTQFMIGTGRKDLDIDTKSLYGNAPETADTKAILQRDLYRNSQWVLTPDKKNYQLVMNVADSKTQEALGMSPQNSATGKGTKLLFNKSGNPVQIPVASLNQPANWSYLTRLKMGAEDFSSDYRSAAKHVGEFAVEAAAKGAKAMMVGGAIMAGASAVPGTVVPPGDK